MQNSQDLQRDLAAASLDAIGGEPLAGSSFETEEPESGFAQRWMTYEQASDTLVHAGCHDPDDVAPVLVLRVEHHIEKPKPDMQKTDVSTYRWRMKSSRWHPW